MSLIKICFLLSLAVITLRGSIIPMKVDWDSSDMTFYNDIREITIDAVGFIPVIGSAVRTLLDLFWPVAEGKQDDVFWHAIEHMVDEKIVASVKLDLQASLDQAKDYMNHYQLYLNEHPPRFGEAGGALTDAIQNCGDAMTLINQWTITIKENPDYYYAFVPIMAPLASLHLSNLREKYLFADQLYEKQDGTTDKKVLNDTYHYYKNWFDSYYAMWYKHRSDKIKEENYNRQHWKLHDEETGISWYSSDIWSTLEDDDDYCEPGDNVESYFDGTKMAIMNEVQNYVMHILSPTFYLHKYVPWLNSSKYFDAASNRTKAVITNSLPKTIIFGPYSSAERRVGSGTHPTKIAIKLMGYWGHLQKNDKEYIDEPGIIKFIQGTHGDYINYIQVNYTSHLGKRGVRQKGGEHYKINVNYHNTWITSIRVSFRDDVVSKLEFRFNNGTQVGVYGGHHYVDFNATMHNNDWKVTAISQVEGKVAYGFGLCHDSYSKLFGTRAIMVSLTNRDYF